MSNGSSKLVSPQEEAVLKAFYQSEEQIDNSHLLQHILFSQSYRKSYCIQQRIKRLVDIILAFIGLLILLPLLLVIGVLVKSTSPGPIFYQSLRIGKDYKPFYMVKFRTMQVNANSLRDKLRKKANLQGNLFKLKNDPRVTRFGSFLRAYSLDELPQLWNVLKGDMSLVGPRPLPPDESGLFKAPYHLRFRITPGLTGLWQISGRSGLSFQQFCDLEMSYLLRWNLWADFMIIFKTFPVVLSSRGAY